MPRVSVIMPAHNAGPYVSQALESVARQTYTDWEVVAVDDGSSDGTWSILEQAGERVRTLRNETATGPASARNRAIAEAVGELIVFLDADDLLLPDYLAQQVAQLELCRARDQRVGAVSCDALLLDDGEYASHTYLDMIRDWRRPITIERVLRRNPIYISALVPREVGEVVGWFDPELFGTEDMGLWLKILERGYEVVLNPRPLAVYRRRTGSVSSNIASQGANNRRAYELALDRRGLNRRQRRIARSAIRYSVAMEAVARVRFGHRRAAALLSLVRLAPTLIAVAASNPQWWGQWITVLRTGRQPVARRRSR